jgi:hypothetical protein
MGSGGRRNLLPLSWRNIPTLLWNHFIQNPQSGPEMLGVGIVVQERQGALSVFHELALFMMVAVVLQISQTTVNGGFSRIHALNQQLWI